MIPLMMLKMKIYQNEQVKYVDESIFALKIGSCKYISINIPSIIAKIQMIIS